MDINTTESTKKKYFYTILFLNNYYTVEQLETDPEKPHRISNYF